MTGLATNGQNGNSEKASWLLEQAMQALRAGKYYQAIDYFEQVVSEIEPIPQVYHFLAMAYLGTHKLKQALAAAQAEIQVFPENETARALCTRIQAAIQGSLSPVPRDIPNTREWHPEQRLFRTDLSWDTLRGIDAGRCSFSYKGLPFPRDPMSIALNLRMLEQLRPRTILEVGLCGTGASLWLADTIENLKLDCSILSLTASTIVHPRIRTLDVDLFKIDCEPVRVELSSLPHPMLVLVASEQPTDVYKTALRFFDAVATPSDLIVLEGSIGSQLQPSFKVKAPAHYALHEFFAAHSGEYEIASEYSDFFGTNMSWAQHGFLRKVAHPLNNSVPRANIASFKMRDPGVRGIQSRFTENERFQLFIAACQLGTQHRSPLFFSVAGESAGIAVLLIYHGLRAGSEQLAGFVTEAGPDAILGTASSILGQQLLELPCSSLAACSRIRRECESHGRRPVMSLLGTEPSRAEYQTEIREYFDMLAPGGFLIIADKLGGSSAVQPASGASIADSVLSQTDKAFIRDVPTIYPTKASSSNGAPSRLRFYQKLQ